MTASFIQKQSLSGGIYRNDIQGLRAIAVLAVIFFHVNKKYLPGGFVGVDMFFVISGFLVGGIILRQKLARQFSFIEFYKARCRRIVPAYFAMVSVVSIFAAILFIPKDFSFFWKSLKSTLYFASNQYFSGFGDYFGPKSYEMPLLHTWSLAVEMQFYLLLPLFLVVIPLRWVRKISLALIFILGLRKQTRSKRLFTQ
ncbi:hypothetical protein AXE65_12705 [Ventosimonas gracilis]|uniref:Acyltransferase 3 domain-containing protein n=1 Tax=Ventosimonas gracilis TaxID=1680762 RepID=A0A139SVQ5_9GAMM|nr:acyltransferase [Ventosimonas gracilis]KXU38659.1 hypothetical protein AXE65_12705 [Ventosimonas gracilis]